MSNQAGYVRVTVEVFREGRKSPDRVVRNTIDFERYELMPESAGCAMGNAIIGLIKAENDVFDSDKLLNELFLSLGNDFAFAFQLAETGGAYSDNARNFGRVREREYDHWMLSQLGFDKAVPPAVESVAG
jgi:hypothetical protein